jgi:hypothetical protein
MERSAHHQIEKPINDFVICTKHFLHFVDRVRDRESGNFMDRFVRNEVHEIDRELAEEHL